MNTIIVGLDGGEWGVIDEMIEEGRMPNVDSLIRGGCSAGLRSTMPPVSPLAWNSIYTGVNPGMHGIYDFSEIQPDYSLKSVSSADRQATPFWDILNDNGISTGLFKAPFTYPVQPLDGFFVAGFPQPTNQKGTTYPESIRGSVGPPDRLFEDTSLIAKGEFEALQRDLYQTVEYQTDVLLNILEDTSVNCLMTVYDGADRIQHYFWKNMDHSHERHDPSRFEDAISKYYELFDIALGRLIQRMSDDANILLVSDHGFGPLEYDVNVERLLSDNGFLRWEDPSQDGTEGRALSGRIIWTIWDILKKLDVHEFVRSVLPEDIMEKGRQVSSKQKTNYRWSRTDAFFSTVSSQSIFINLESQFNHGSVGDTEYDAIVDEIVNELRSLEDPRSGEVVMDSVMRADELYEGWATDSAPDIVLNAAERYAITGGPETKLISQSSKDGVDRSGDHSRTGIFVANGPQFASDERFDEDLDVMDIAPIILHLHNCPLPNHFDGSLPKRAFSSNKLCSENIDYTDSYGPNGKASHEWSDEEQEQLQDNLKDLGYLE